MSQQRRRGPMGGHGMQPDREGQGLQRLHGKSSSAIWADINSVLSWCLSLQWQEQRLILQARRSLEKLPQSCSMVWLPR